MYLFIFFLGSNTNMNCLSFDSKIPQCIQVHIPRQFWNINFLNKKNTNEMAKRIVGTISFLDPLLGAYVGMRLM